MQSAQSVGLQAALQKLEYEPTEQNGRLSAPNRAHELRLTFSEAGLSVEERESGTPLVALGLTSFGRPGAQRALSKVAPRASGGSRVERNWEGIAEWFLNQPEGVEHGWTVKTRVEGTGPLLLSVAVSGVTVIASGSHAVFESKRGRALQYGALKALDAAGIELPSHMSVTSDGLHIEVDDSEARYPIVIDPLLTSSTWTVESDQLGGFLGRSVASAGDVNGDGYSDVVVGAPFFDNGEADEGQALLYLGSASGLSSMPAWTAESNQAGAVFGITVASAGDVNGDGYSDVLVASQFDNGEVDEGRVSLYLGSVGGLTLTAAWTAESNQADSMFGSRMASAGDVNGDGYSDVVIGAFFFDNGEANEGRAFVYLGGASGLSPMPAWTAESNQAAAEFGGSVESAGDVNGDGYSDVVVGALFFDNGEVNEGRAFVYLGGASGLSPTPAWTIEVNQADARLGLSASAGDVNGDGYSDVVVSAVGFTNGEVNEGRSFLYLGGASGLSSTAVWTAESNQAYVLFGYVTSAGDVNGDGYSDVVVGAREFDNGQIREGRVFLYVGSASGLSQTPAWTAESNQAGAIFGTSLASAGDVDGDGFSDVVVGAPSFDNGEIDEGRAFLFRGSASGLTANSVWSAEGNQAGASFGVSVASAGDVDGDGFSDVVVGAQSFDNGEIDEGRALLFRGSASGLSAMPAWTAESDQANAFLGTSVASAGDVNGDGYSDVLVGAPFFGNEGRAFLFLGSASGLRSTPAWTGTSSQAGARFGTCVASAGDVNGDGYSDVVVGAPNFANGQSGEGGAFVYLGSASGLIPAPVWNAESDQVGGNFGASVAGAGDVNGDGYSDVVVGAPQISNPEFGEGRAYLYLGSASGLSPAPAWTAESNRSGSNLAQSVASAGDVNGDGYSDVVVGAPFYFRNQIYDGQAVLYLGNSSGLTLTPAWTVWGSVGGALLGNSVVSAGDVNGDGYSDVVLGERGFSNGENSEGRASIFLGSGGGLNPTPAWTTESNQVGASSGSSVASAGDVNGDGYSDVVVGAALFDNGEADEGGAFLFFGGDGAPGRPRGLTQRLSGAMPAGLIAHGVAPVTLTGFGANALATQGRVSLETEVKAVGTRFDGSSLVRSPLGLAHQQQAATWPVLAPGRYHWRARLVSEQEGGRWISFGANSEAEADFVIVTPQPDAGIVDAGIDDAGVVDAGIVDAGVVDAGVVDAGIVDAGIVDAGIVDERAVGAVSYAVGCGCGAAPSSATLFFLVFSALRLSKRIRRRNTAARPTAPTGCASPGRMKA
jgi:hypothetical protein